MIIVQFNCVSMKTKKETDYKLLYHELLEDYQRKEAEITSLKRRIGGYITQSSKIKNKLAELEADYDAAKKSVNSLTQVSLENKAMVKECITREQEMEESYKEQIRVKDHHILKLTEDLADQKIRNEEAERTMLFYKGNYNYFKNLPWYKRLFVK